MMYSVTIIEFNCNLGNKVDDVLAFIDYDSAIYYVEEFNKDNRAKPGDKVWCFAMEPIPMHTGSKI